MNRIGVLFPIFLSAGLFFVGCKSSSKKETATSVTGQTVSNDFNNKMNSSANWQANMQMLEKVLLEVYPISLSVSEFGNKKNETMILDSLTRLSEISKKVSHSPMTVLNDPTLGLISFDFSEQMHDIKTAFEMNKKDYARFELLKTTQYCVECHTQSNKGPNFSYSQFTEKIKTLPILDQAELYTATRRFDEAISCYQRFFAQDEVSWDSQFKSELAIHNALSVLIRHKRDPKLTLEFLDQVQKAKFIPVYLKNIISVWKSDVKIWQKEAKSKTVTLTNIKVWTERSNSRSFEYGKLGSEIWTQLSISYLHEFLENIKFAKVKADVLWMLGTSYINGLNSYQGQLGEKYLEACIRTFPNSSYSNRCYSKLEEYVYDMNTGSVGTFLSVEQDQKLKSLKKMAEPK